MSTHSSGGRQRSGGAAAARAVQQRPNQPRTGRGFTHAEFQAAMANARLTSRNSQSTVRTVTMGGRSYTVRPVEDASQARREMAASAMARAMGMAAYTVPVYPERGPDGERYLVSPVVQGARSLMSMSDRQLEQVIHETLPPHILDRFVLYDYLTGHSYRSLDDYRYVPPRVGQQRGRLVLVQQPRALTNQRAFGDPVPHRFRDAAASPFGRLAFRTGNGRGENNWEQHEVSRAEVQRIIDQRDRIAAAQDRFREPGLNSVAIPARLQILSRALTSTAAEDRPLRAGDIDDYAFWGAFRSERPKERSYSRAPGENATFNYPTVPDMTDIFKQAGWHHPTEPTS